MYFALQHQCPVQQTSAVVKFIVEEMSEKKIVKFIVEEMSEKKIKKTPSISTVSRMSLEPSVIRGTYYGSHLNYSNVEYG